jgi:hypothetical protein
MMAAGGVSPVEVTFSSSNLLGTNTSTYIFTGAAPTATADDVVVVCITAGAETRTISSVTVDGNAMSLVIASNGAESCAIYSYAGSTDGSGDVVVTWSNGQGRCGIGVYVLTNASDTASDTASDVDTSGALSTTIDCPAGGAVIAMTGCRSSNDSDPAEFSWSLSAEDFDEQIEGGNDLSHTGGSEEFVAAQTSLAVTCTPNRTYASARLLVASFGA